MSKRAKPCAGDLSGMPHSRCKAPCEGIPVSPPEIKKPPFGGYLFNNERYFGDDLSRRIRKSNHFF